jgi:hypothetical protein
LFPASGKLLTTHNLSRVTVQEGKIVTKELRLRIIILQVLLIVVFALGAATAVYAGNFTQQQIRSQLEPQQISFPADAKSGLPAELSQYAGQQVLNGEQAHAYADGYIAMHLAKTGEGHPYSYWSTQTRTETDPTLKAEYAAKVDSLFRGETLRSMLNQAWAFGTMGTIAMFAGLGLAIAALLVTLALLFELFVAPGRVAQPLQAGAVVPGAA